MLGVYNYTVIMTYVATLVSFFGMTLVFKDGDCSLKAALICLMISGVLDMFDGAVAATKKNRTEFQKKFGIQIDSMCDLICYGVFPALIVFKLGNGNWIITAISGLFLLCALIRLSYFNVEEEERQNATSDKRTCYLGMPVTMISLIFPCVYTICTLLKFPLNGWIGAGVLSVCGLAFITPFKCIKPKIKGKIVLIVIGLAVLAGFFLLKA